MCEGSMVDVAVLIKSDFWRGIVCAVARSAWLDEAEVQDTHTAKGNELYHIAKNNARAWAALAKETPK